jgi:hypothetical protein
MKVNRGTRVRRERQDQERSREALNFAYLYNKAFSYQKVSKVHVPVHYIMLVKVSHPFCNVSQNVDCGASSDPDGI